MQIDCAFLPKLIDQRALSAQIAVVIDILRASTVIIAALDHGCRAVYPVRTRREAFQLKRTLISKKPLLAGERSGLCIPGFDLGNSPNEFPPRAVRDRTVIMTTTNGTAAIIKAQKARALMIGAFTNLSALTEVLKTADEILLVCSGQDAKIANEDLACAGAIIDRLLNVHHELQLTDPARIALWLYRYYANDLPHFLETACEHGRKLVQLGFEADLEYASRIGISKVVPILELSSKRLKRL